jgi:lysophospholipase L1-like esterase
MATSCGFESRRPHQDSLPDAPLALLNAAAQDAVVSGANLAPRCCGLRDEQAMSIDTLQIPVQPEPFEFELQHFAQSLRNGGLVNIVALGSSTTAGEGGIAPYPSRLQALLTDQYSTVAINVINRGIGGQEAPAELERMRVDVIDQKPSLVIWQVGTNAVWQPADQHPPTFDATTDAIQEGLSLLLATNTTDVILMDLQYVPALLTPAKRVVAKRMVIAIGEIARKTRVNVFRRFALMKAWHQIEGISFDRMVDPGDQARLHDSDWATARMSQTLKDQIVSAVGRTPAI